MQDIKVLVVEDEAITAMDIKGQLQRLGYRVPAISDTGESAIRAARETQPHVILMDIILKGTMDGTMTAKEITKFSNAPIIFLTAFKDDESFAKAKDSNPYAYLTKPYDIRDLRNTIELALFKQKAEIKLSLAEQRYHSILENATCGILITDNEHFILDANQEAEKILGIPKIDLFQQNWLGFLDNEEKHYLELQKQKLLLDKVIGPHETTLHQQGGVKRSIEYSIVSIDNQFENFNFCILNDITERNRMRKQSLLADKLATIGTLSAGIFHEIKSPLTFIISNLEYISKLIENEKTKLSLENAKELSTLSKIHEATTDTLEGTTRIREILNNLKGFIRAPNEDLEPVDIHEILNSAITISKPQFKNCAHIQTNFSLNIPLLMLNRNKLEQVFLNLIVNASQAMEGGSFENNIISVTTYQTDNKICIDFKDTGKGIPKEMLSNIFEPFFSTKPVGVGTGLGLSICRDIILSVGGEIEADSVEGQHTIFTVKLPMNLIIEKDTAPEFHAHKQIKTILIIDDEPALLETLRHVLGKDYEVITAKSGRSGCNIIDKNMYSIDLIITDLNISDVNGADIHRYVSLKNPELANRMFFITGGNHTKSTLDFIENHKPICFDTPFTINQLLNAIKNLSC